MKIKTLFQAILFALTFLQQVSATLQVYPTRILLTDKKRTAQVALRHIGDKPKKYRITVVYYRMSSDGGMTEVPKPTKEDLFAGDYFKYSPRVADLQPNVEQVVRLILRKPSDLPEGEYRAHLHFEEEDPAAPVPEVKKGEMKMTLIPKLAIAIPVIVRQGNPQTNVVLKNLKVVTLPDKKKAFNFAIEKQGNGVVYGDLRAFQITKDGNSVLVGEVNGVSSYISQRTATYPFSDKINFNLKKAISFALNSGTPPKKAEML